jgi:hypothetical protein
MMVVRLGIISSPNFAALTGDRSKLGLHYCVNIYKVLYKVPFTCLVSLYLFCQIVAAMPQANSGTLFGTVHDSRGARIPKARITATLIETPKRRSLRIFKAEANEEGRFVLRNLPAGVYEVSVSVEFSETQTESSSLYSKGEICRARDSIWEGV